MSARGNFVDAGPWNHNAHYHELVLSSRAWPCAAALDVGCGDGVLVRLLAERADTVVGIDSSAVMIERARRATASANVSYLLGDVLAHDFGGIRFDFIACVAAVHHMEFTTAVARMKSLLAPGGTLAILGLANSGTPLDLALDAVGFVVSRYRRLRPGAQRHADAPLAAPAETYGEVKRRAFRVLPGARFRRLVLFRYLLTWTNVG
jgi:SAM-dependent methyltransferase